METKLSFHVEDNKNGPGPGGRFTYVEDGRRLNFEWEYLISA